MHRDSQIHHALRRSPAHLDSRTPSLINLPVPVNSIPIVGPLVSPLVGDASGDATQSSPSPNPQPASVSISVSGASSGSGGGTSNGNGGGNSGSKGASASNGGGGTSQPTASPAAAGKTAVASPPQNPSPSASTPGKPSGSPSAGSASSGGTVHVPSISGTATANSLVTSGGKTATVKAAPGPSTGTAVVLGESNSGAFATGVLSPSQYSLGSSSNTAVAPLPTITTIGAIPSAKQLSSGGIAGILIVCLLALLALIVFVVRRRSIARRVELRQQWWFGRRGSRGNFAADSPSGSYDEETSGGRRSARSSFATNFDQGLMFAVDSSRSIPEPPPTAEIRDRNPALMSSAGAVTLRESLNSMLSNGSDSDTRYLIVSPSQNDLDPSSPMFVRPFSPSESFAFPKPPAPLGDSPGLATPRSSTATLVHFSMPSRAFTPVATPPFPSQKPAPLVASAGTPFTEPAKPEFTDVEIIRRPFVPTLDDEMVVRAGDRVRILQIFDDGWAFVEKLAEREIRPERGLIPVDCLREADRDLAPFVKAQKSVSSHVVDQFTPVAL